MPRKKTSRDILKELAKENGVKVSVLPRMLRIANEEAEEFVKRLLARVTNETGREATVVAAAVAGMTLTEIGRRLLQSVEATDEPAGKLTKSSAKFIADVEELRQLYKTGWRDDRRTPLITRSRR